jgi:hypothetical protein
MTTPSTVVAVPVGSFAVISKVEVGVGVLIPIYAE